ncbi:MAG: phosphoenolpyruvate--protein phosphotransferase [Ignavibacteria bacterium]|nr:MAG: phosphoenolpyruvate--protein phosphotransferase [Ignavibacteria bacterium]
MNNGKQEIILKGLPSSGGIAIGTAYLYHREEVYVTERILTDEELEAELVLLDEAIERSRHEVQKIANFAHEKLNEEAAQIFESQLLMLDDVEMRKALDMRLRREKKNADFLVYDELQKYKELLGGASDELLRERVVDLDEIGQRIMRNLQKKRLHSTVEGEHVIIASQLTPSDTILFSKNDVLGYATDLGGITSHAAILSRSLKIPAVTALHTVTAVVQTGDEVILDGQRGLLIVNPTQDHREEYELKLRRIANFEAELKGLVDLPCETPDNHKVELSANAEFINELEYVVTQGSKGIGLYRTEHLYIEKGDFPSEQEQYVEYSEIAHMLYPQQVIFRTFDIGGDKLLDTAVPESNPFLGWRGIRMMLDKPEIFRQQLRALLRASTMKNIKIMFPMISGLTELLEVLELLNDVKEELRGEGMAFDESMEIGLMIEVPSAVFIADELAKHVQFFSIGTNDLVQYLMAVDRNNELIADLYQEFHPAVLRAIKHTIDTGHANGLWVGMCGEMAGNPLATLLLLGMGLDEYSMVPSVIPEVKTIIRSTPFTEAKAVADEALSLSNSFDVRSFLYTYMRDHFPELYASWMTGENGENDVE